MTDSADRMDGIDVVSADGDGPAADQSAAAGRREEVRIPLPEKFDPARHQKWLLQKLSERRGSGWKLELVDMHKRVAIASRTLTLNQVREATKSTKLVDLQTDVKPSDGDRLAAQFAEQFPGFHMTEFDPHLRRAKLARLSDDEVHARGAVADVMRVKPWKVHVSARIGGGFDMVLPPGYLPSKHDQKLNDVAQTVIGRPGWYARFDGRTGSGCLVPGALPTFPPVLPHPMARVVTAEVRTRWDPKTGDWGRIPIGVLLAGAGEPDNQLLRTDFEANPSLQISGLAGSGKGQLIMSLIAGALAHGIEVGLVDAVKGCVDYTDFKPFLKPGFCAEDLEQAVCVLQMAYTEGQRRKKLIKQARVQKFSQLPDSLQIRPLLLVVDEATSLLQAEPVPKGLPKQSPLLEEIGQRNLLRATALNTLSKIPRELRFTGISLAMASQVASATVGIPTELRTNLPAKILLGSKPTEGNRKLALANPDVVPTVPAYIAEDSKGAARGVGVFEFEGRTPGVFKGFFNEPTKLASWLGRLGLPTCDDPMPTPAQMAANLPQIDAADHGDGADRGRSGRPDGERAPSGRAAVAVRHQMGDDWDVDSDTGERLSGFAKANRARHVSAQIANRIATRIANQTASRST